MSKKRRVSVVRIFAFYMIGVSMWVSQVHAFRMIQNTAVGRVTAGSRVMCNDPGGFAHWATCKIDWRLNTAGQGSGKSQALQSACESWNLVAGADYKLECSGTTSAGFVTDNINSVVWAVGNGCSGSCLALTALVLQSGQVIVESDITFNANYTWATNGADYDTEAVAAHELGHSLGIHHTEVTSGPVPTMFASYFGTSGRSLEADDHAALQCAANRYPCGACPCDDPCPTGGVYDGANCYMYSVPGNQPFVWNGAFYYQPLWHPNGPCPHAVWDNFNGTSIQPVYDTANCYIASANGGPNPFIYSGNYYISASPGADPCPFGGTYDGANCYMFSWPGVNPFIWSGNMYYEPVWHPDGNCPHVAYNNFDGSSVQPWFDGANCVVMIGPGGNQVPFIYDNNYYLTPACTPCSGLIFANGFESGDTSAW